MPVITRRKSFNILLSSNNKTFPPQPSPQPQPTFYITPLGDRPHGRGDQKHSSRDFKCFSDMDGFPAGKIRYLMAATETIRYDHCFRMIFNRRYQYTFCHFLRQVIMLCFVSKRSGHTTTTTIDFLILYVRP